MLRHAQVLLRPVACTSLRSLEQAAVGRRPEATFVRAAAMPQVSLMVVPMERAMQRVELAGSPSLPLPRTFHHSPLAEGSRQVASLYHTRQSYEINVPCLAMQRASGGGRSFICSEDSFSLASRSSAGRRERHHPLFPMDATSLGSCPRMRIPSASPARMTVQSPPLAQLLPLRAVTGPDLSLSVIACPNHNVDVRGASVTSAEGGPPPAVLASEVSSLRATAGIGAPYIDDIHVVLQTMRGASDGRTTFRTIARPLHARLPFADASSLGI